MASDGKPCVDSIVELTMLQVTKDDKIICIDVETTGLDPNEDEILQLSICDGNEYMLFDHLIMPSHHDSWPNAQRIHGITPEMVADQKKLVERKGEIEAILNEAELMIGYNLDFDVSMLEAAGISVPACQRFDVMREFACVYGKYSKKYGDYTWVKLTEAARHYHIEFDAHDASEDVVATTRVYHELIEDEAYFDKVAGIGEADEAATKAHPSDPNSGTVPDELFHTSGNGKSSQDTSRLERAAQSMQSTGESMQKTGKAMADTGHSLTKGCTVPILVIFLFLILFSCSR